MARIRLEDFTEKNLTQKLDLKGRLIGLTAVLPATIFLLWLLAISSVKFADVLQGPNPVHGLVYAGMALLTFFTYFFCRITLKLAGLEQQTRLVSPYLYHPYVFFILSVFMLFVAITKFLSAGEPKEIIELIKTTGVGFFLFVLGMTVRRFWKN